MVPAVGVSHVRSIQETLKFRLKRWGRCKVNNLLGKIKSARAKMEELHGRNDGDGELPKVAKELDIDVHKLYHFLSMFLDTNWGKIEVNSVLIG
ncbi:MAG: hypothetical protein Q8808_02550 [Candidatus Phytoplasma australasiaticum]|nr:hypothetical protein [Candidatus Phytoplasma australasiaticum]